ncbi:lantibiotic dehydratase C-terminal domain-containing protein [Streptomyces erythrochromogenes]|uniref:lantibiotic dehydratase C-terminal domain-containing protein n=1 Tax=Streptomyces erythrochromogenes TaxID=285574 RepID=UPI0033E94D49
MRDLSSLRTRTDALYEEETAQATARLRDVLSEPVSAQGLAQAVPSRGALVPFEQRPFAGTHVGVEATLYEPEEGKYGGPLGAALAEEVFQHSSELALWAGHLPRRPDRVALAALLLTASAAALQDRRTGTDTSRFWERHALPGGPMTVEGRPKRSAYGVGRKPCPHTSRGPRPCAFPIAPDTSYSTRPT